MGTTHRDLRAAKRNLEVAAQAAGDWEMADNDAEGADYLRQSITYCDLAVNEIQAVVQTMRELLTTIRYD